MDFYKLPKHLAVIMDGNGRWAKQLGKPRTAGHLQGSENVRRIALECNRLGIETLTLYAFSTENWARPAKEIEYLCKLPELFFKKYIKELKEENIRVTCIGEYQQFPKNTVQIIESAIEKTQGNTGLNLCLAVNYGGQREIALAAQAYAADVVAGKIDNVADAKVFERYLMGESKQVDLLIRTSGEVRISNFLLWQIAYAEMMFVDCAWPEFDEEQLHDCLRAYQARDRRYGGLKDEN